MSVSADVLQEQHNIMHSPMVRFRCLTLSCGIASIPLRLRQELSCNNYAKPVLSCNWIVCAHSNYTTSQLHFQLKLRQNNMIFILLLFMFIKNSSKITNKQITCLMDKSALPVFEWCLNHDCNVLNYETVSRLSQYHQYAY